MQKQRKKDVFHKLFSFFGAFVLAVVALSVNPESGQGAEAKVNQRAVHHRVNVGRVYRPYYPVYYGYPGYYGYGAYYGPQVGGYLGFYSAPYYGYSSYIPNNYFFPYPYAAYPY